MDGDEVGYEPVPTMNVSVEANSRSKNWKISVQNAPDRKTLKVLLAQAYEEVQDLIRIAQTGGN